MGVAGYDAGGQLTNNNGTTINYDDAGNRTGGSYGVTLDNEMSADADWTYLYDKEGNLKEKDTTAGGSSESWTYAYSGSNLLTQVKHYDSTATLVLTVDYKYDAFGEEIQRDTSGSINTTTKFGVDGWNSNADGATGNAGMVRWAVLNSNGTLQTRNIEGNGTDQHLGRIDQTGASDPNGAYYLIADRLNSTRDVINASGTLKDSLAYDGFGKIQGGELDSLYRGGYAYTGREIDAETDLQWNHARWYDAKMGRWISQDPLGFDAGDSNLYRYVNNRATGATDPGGFQAQSVGGLEGAATTVVGAARQFLVAQQKVPEIKSMTLIKDPEKIPAFAKPALDHFKKIKLPRTVNSRTLADIGPINDPTSVGEAVNTYWILVKGSNLGEARFFQEKYRSGTAAGQKDPSEKTPFKGEKHVLKAGKGGEDDSPNPKSVFVSPDGEYAVIVDSPGIRPWFQDGKKFGKQFFPMTYEANFVVFGKSKKTNQLLGEMSYNVMIQMSAPGKVDVNRAFEVK